MIKIDIQIFVVVFCLSFYIFYIQGFRYLFAVKMNRFDRSASRVSATPSVQSNQSNFNNDRLNQITPVVKIIGTFFLIKQKNNLKAFFERCKKIAKYNKKRGNIAAAFLHGLQNRKQKLYLLYSYRKLLSHRDEQIQKQNEQIEAQKNILKSKSAALLGIIYRKLEHKKIKSAFLSMVHETKGRSLLQSFRNRHILRILNNLYLDKLRLGFDNMRNNKLTYLKKRNVMRRMERVFSNKRQHNILTFFAKILSLPSTKQNKVKQIKPKVQSTRNSRAKQLPEKPITRVPEVQNSNEEQKKKQLQEKNRKLEEEIERIQQNFQKIANQQRNQISDLEAQHERLKFNSGILDSDIQDLQSQIINRQKKLRKGMSISELWQRVYSNFLLFLKKYEGQIISKQIVLQYLQQPLTPLNINLQNMKAQNDILTNLLEQYKKFFEEKVILDTNEQNLLPFDILVEKNKFLYAAIQSLIRHGLGTEAQIKQLESDIQNASKQS